MNLEMKEGLIKRVCRFIAYPFAYVAAVVIALWWLAFGNDIHRGDM